MGVLETRIKEHKVANIVQKVLVLMAASYTGQMLRQKFNTPAIQY